MNERSVNPLDRDNEELKRIEEVEQELLFQDADIQKLDAENQKLSAENQKLRAEIQELVTKYEKENEIAQNYLIDSYLKDAEISELEDENSALKADFDANVRYNTSNSQRIAAAIREMQLMNDPNDPQKYFFWRKYQWRAVFDAMCHYRLLPNLYDDDNGKAAFCDICDDQDHSLHFLPADHHEIGDCRGRYNRSSVYHQMTNSKPDDPRAKYYEIYDATYAVFEKLLLSHGAIDCIS